MSLIRWWFELELLCHVGFPDSSVGKEPACNAGDPSLIPESGRSPLQNINTFLDTAAINHRNAVCFHLERSAINSHCPICYVKSFSSVQFISVQFSRSVVSDSLRPHELQHARPPYPSPTPGVHPNLCPSSRWYHPAISSSVVPFSSCPQSLPASIFSSESTLRIRWPKYWSFSFSISPSKEHPGLISFRICGI